MAKRGALAKATGRLVLAEKQNCSSSNADAIQVVAFSANLCFFLVKIRYCEKTKIFERIFNGFCNYLAISKESGRLFQIFQFFKEEATARLVWAEKQNFSSSNADAIQVVELLANLCFFGKDQILWEDQNIWKNLQQLRRLRFLKESPRFFEIT